MKVAGPPPPPRPAGATQPQIAGHSGASAFGWRGRGRGRLAVATSPARRPRRPAAWKARQQRQHSERTAPRAAAHDYRASPAPGAGDGITTTGTTGIASDHPGEAGPQGESGRFCLQKQRNRHVLLLSRRAGHPCGWFGGRLGGRGGAWGTVLWVGSYAGGLPPSRREDRGQRKDKLGVYYGGDPQHSGAVLRLRPAALPPPWN